MGVRFDKFKAIVKKFSNKEEVIHHSPEDGILSSQLSEDAKNLINDMFEKLGPRPAATKESRRAARYIASLFEEYTQDVTITSARIYTSMMKGLLASVLIFSVLVLLFTVFNMPIIALALIAAWSFSFFMQLKRKRNIFKPFMPSDEAANVHAIIEPDEIVEETVVFTAHHDSASENKIQSYLSFKYFSLFYIPALGFVILLLTSIAQFILDVLELSFSPKLASFPIIIFSLIGTIFTCFSLIGLKAKGREFVSGAGDNLSGIAVVVELLRYFSFKKNSGAGLKHIRLVFASFDGEECRVQGSEAWYRNNNKLLFNAKVINFDGLYRAEDLVFLTQDGNGLVPLTPSLASRCTELAHSMGYKICMGKLGIMGGETDAVSAVKAGYRATTLTSMRPEVKTPAHTKDDTPDKVELEALSEAIAIGIKFVEEEDLLLNKEVRGESKTFLEYDRKYKLIK